MKQATREKKLKKKSLYTSALISGTVPKGWGFKNSKLVVFTYQRRKF